MAVVTITSPADFETLDPAGFPTCCGLAPLVERVTSRNKRNKGVWVLIQCCNPACELHGEERGVFSTETGILAKWEKYRNAEDTGG